MGRHVARRGVGGPHVRKRSPGPPATDAASLPSPLIVHLTTSRAPKPRPGCPLSSMRGDARRGVFHTAVMLGSATDVLVSRLMILVALNPFHAR